MHQSPAGQVTCTNHRQDRSHAPITGMTGHMHQSPAGQVTCTNHRQDRSGHMYQSPAGQVTCTNHQQDRSHAPITSRTGHMHQSPAGQVTCTNHQQDRSHAPITLQASAVPARTANLPFSMISTRLFRWGSTAHPIRMAICWTIFIPVCLACQDFLLRQTALRKGSSDGMPSADATTAKALQDKVHTVPAAAQPATSFYHSVQPWLGT